MFLPRVYDNLRILQIRRVPADIQVTVGIRVSGAEDGIPAVPPCNIEPGIANRYVGMKLTFKVARPCAGATHRAKVALMLKEEKLAGY
jgi:hypothetical protein